MELKSSDHLKFVSAGNNVILWETTNYSVCNRYNLNPAQTVNTIHWSSDFQQIVAVPSSGEKIVLTLVKPKRLQHAEFVTGEENTVAKFSSMSPRFLGVGTKSGRTLLWDAKLKKCTKCFFTQKSEVTCLDFNFNASYLTSGFINGRIVVNNNSSGQSSTLCSQENKVIRDLKYSSHHKAFIGSVSDDGSLALWDVNAKKCIHSLPNCHTAPVTGLCFSPTEQYMLATVGLDKFIKLYDFQMRKVAVTVECASPLTSVDLKEDGYTIAVGNMRGEVLVYDMRSKDHPIFTLSAHSSAVKSIMYQKTVKTSLVGPKPKSNKEDVKKVFEHSQVSQLSNSDAISSNGQEISMAEDTKRPSLSMDAFSPLVDGSKPKNDSLLDFGDACSKLSNSSENQRLPFSISPRPYKTRDSFAGVFSPVQDSDRLFERSNDKLSCLASEPSDVINRLSLGSCINEKDRSSQLLDPQNEMESYVEYPDNLRLHNIDSIPHSDPIYFNLPRDSFSPARYHANCNGLDLNLIETNGVGPVVENHRGIPEYQNLNNNGVDEGNMLVDEGRGTAGTNTPLTPHGFQTEYIRQIVSDCLEDFADDMRQQLVRNHIRMIREHTELLDEMKKMLEQNTSENELISEINKLKFENDFYKSAFR